MLEELLIPHEVREGVMQIRNYRAFIACLGLDENLKKRAVLERAVAGKPPRSRHPPVRVQAQVTGPVPGSADAWAGPGNPSPGR